MDMSRIAILDFFELLIPNTEYVPAKIAPNYASQRRHKTRATGNKPQRITTTLAARRQPANRLAYKHDNLLPASRITGPMGFKF